jgi:HEAT repeat protein
LIPALAFGVVHVNAVQALIIELADPDAGVRNDAAIALYNLGPAAAPAVSALVVALSDDDLSVRGASVLALGAVGAAAKEAVEALLQVSAHDPCHFVRASALESLTLIAPRDIRLMMDLSYLLGPPLVRKNAPRAVELLKTFH